MEEVKDAFDASNVKIKGKKSKRKKSSKVKDKEKEGTELPEIERGNVDTNYNEYGEYSI